MRRFNFQLLIILLVGLLVLGGAVYGLNRFQVRRTANQLLVQAKRAESDKRYDLALNLYDRYLASRPGDAEAQSRYGVLLADAAGNNRAQVELAMPVLDRALAMRPDDEAVVRRLLRANLVLNRLADAKTQADKLLELKPDDSEAELALGFCAEKAEKFEDAAVWYRKSITHAPKELRGYIQLAMLEQTRKAPTKGDQVMDEMVQRNADSSVAYLTRAQYRMQYAPTKAQADASAETAKVRAEAQNAAQADAARAVELSPKSLDALILLSQLAIERKDWKEARRVLNTALEAHPTDPRFYRMMALVEVGEDRPAEAIAVMERGLRITDDIELRFLLTNLLISECRRGNQKAFDRVDGLIQSLVDRGYDKGLVDYLKGYRQFMDQNWPTALVEFQKATPLLLKTAPELQRQATVYMAACQERLGNFTGQYETYRQLASSNLGDPEAMRLVAQALERLGRFEEALEQYLKIPAKTPEVQLAMTRLQIQATLMKPAASRQWREVEASLDALDKALPKDSRVALLRAEMLIAQGRIDQTRSVLEGARNADPKRVENWIALYVLAMRMNQPERVPPLLKEAREALGDTVDMRLLEARYLATPAGASERSRLAALGQGLDKFEPEDQRRLLRGLAETYLVIGDVETALETWMKLANQKEAAEDLYTQLFAFDLAIAAQTKALQSQAQAKATKDVAAEKAAAEEQSRAVAVQTQTIERLKALPDQAAGSFWRMARVRQIIVETRAIEDVAKRKAAPALREAERLLAEIANERSNDPRAALAAAEVDELKGASPIANYVKAVQLGERDLTVIRKVLQILTDEQRYNEAKAVLARLQDRSAMSADIQRMESEILFRSQDPTQALAIAQKVVDAGSTDYRDHVWLGQLLTALGRQADAEKPLLRGVELGQGAPGPYVALTQYYAMTNQLPKAMEAVGQAEKLFSAKKDPMALAQCYELVGLFDKARALYLDALGVKDEQSGAGTMASADAAVLRNYAAYLLRQNRRKEAEPVLEALRKQTRSPEDARWANTLLGILLATSLDSEQSQRALEIMGLSNDPAANLAGLRTEPLADLRAKARVLAVQRDPARRQQAARILETVIERDPTGAGDDLSLLAQMAELDGDWKQAEKLFQRALQLDQRNPRYRIEYVQGLLRHKQPQDAGPWLDQLDSIQNDAPINVQLRALTYQALGQHDQAKGLLMDYGRRRKDQALGASRVLEQMGYVEAAQTLLQEFVAQSQAANPSVLLVLAEFLGRQGRVKEALDLCEPLWGKLPAEQVATTCASVLLGKDEPAQTQRVETHLNEQLANAKDEDARFRLQVPLALLRAIQKRPEEAEALYRKVQEKEPKNTVALNNLAWLLSFQKGKEAEALGFVERALDQVGPQAALLDTRAMVYMAQSRPELAIRDLEMAVGSAPEPAMYFHLARARLMAGQREGALLALQDGERLGLKVGTLDSLEQPLYDQVRKELAGVTGTPKPADGPEVR